jgi:hypothetical protein
VGTNNCFGDKPLSESPALAQTSKKKGKHRVIFLRIPLQLKAIPGRGWFIPSEGLNVRFLKMPWYQLWTMTFCSQIVFGLFFSFPAALYSMIFYIADGFNIADLAIYDFEDMRSRKIKDPQLFARSVTPGTPLISITFGSPSRSYLAVHRISSF